MYYQYNLLQYQQEVHGVDCLRVIIGRNVIELELTDYDRSIHMTNIAMNTEMCPVNVVDVLQ